MSKKIHEYCIAEELSRLWRFPAKNQLTQDGKKSGLITRVTLPLRKKPDLNLMPHVINQIYEEKKVGVTLCPLSSIPQIGCLNYSTRSGDSRLEVTYKVHRSLAEESKIWGMLTASVRLYPGERTPTRQHDIFNEEINIALLQHKFKVNLARQPLVEEKLLEDLITRERELEFARELAKKPPQIIY